MMDIPSSGDVYEELWSSSDELERRHCHILRHRVSGALVLTFRSTALDKGFWRELSTLEEGIELASKYLGK